MKRFLFGIIMLISSTASAQEFKPFKANLSLGYPTSGGLLLSFEPKYGISDQIDVGFRYELGLMSRPLTLDGQDVQSELKASSSYLITGNYLLSQGTFRPFLGAGVGLFTLVSISFSEGSGSTDAGISGGSKFGGMLRAGFKANHFAFGLEYIAVPKTRGVLVGTSGANLNYERPNSYVGIKVGIDIGGGRYE
jgi:outer membrane protein X